MPNTMPRLIALTLLTVCALRHEAAAAPTFAAAPQAARTATGAEITFVLSAPTDVEVAICAADGKVVRHLAAGVLGGTNPPPPTLRMFAPDGRYLRTIIPFPASLPPDGAGDAAARWDAARQAFVPRNFQSGNPITYPVEAGPESIRVAAADAKAGVLLTSGNSTLRVQTDGGKFSGPTPMWSKNSGLKNPNWNAPQLAMSPDG